MVTITNLQVKDEDFIFDGDLRLLGDTEIENGSLTVTGDLVFAETKSDAEKIISPTFKMIGGNLTAGAVRSEDSNGTSPSYDEDTPIIKYFSIKSGDIHITKGIFDINDCDITDVCDIIVENGDLRSGNIFNSHSIYVNYQICCKDINTIFDILCMNADVYGDTNCGRDLYAKEFYDCNVNSIIVNGILQTGKLYNPSSIVINGKSEISSVEIG